jgi:uncharacterized protein YqeY
VSLQQRIQEDTTAAMRSGDALRRDVLRMVANAAYTIEKKQGRALSDDEYVTVLTREVKTRRESVEAYRAGGREDLAGREEGEIAILAGYLPEALTDEELDVLVARAIAETGAATPRDLGKVMGWLTPHTRGRADGKLLSGKVAAALASTGGNG